MTKEEALKLHEEFLVSRNWAPGEFPLWLNRSKKLDEKTVDAVIDFVAGPLREK